MGRGPRSAGTAIAAGSPEEIRLAEVAGLLRESAASADTR